MGKGDDLRVMTLFPSQGAFKAGISDCRFVKLPMDINSCFQVC